MKKLHPRVIPVAMAHNAVEKAVLDVLENWPDLTYLELFYIFNQIMASWIKRGIQGERHPGDHGKYGGEE